MLAERATARRAWVLAGALLLATAGAEAREPNAVAEPEPSSTRRALAVGASVVPGVVAHGAGHYVAGDSSTGAKLLIAEGVGLGMVLGGGAGLFLTGASRYTVGPLAAISMFGVGVFGTSWFADIYGSAATDQEQAWARGAGAPAFFESELGYRYVYTPIFAYRSFMVERFAVWLHRTRFEPSAWLSFGQGNARYRLQVAERLYGASPGLPRRLADLVDLELALTRHRYAPESFTRSTIEASTRTRYDLAHLGDSLRGAFVEASLGYAFAGTTFDFSGAEANIDDLLLGTMGFGVQLRGPLANGSEALVYYDHRHDDFAAGLTASGLGSGIAGHFGLRTTLFFDERFGASMEGQVGSAAVIGASLVLREPGPTRARMQ